MKSNLAEYKLVELWRDLISREDTLVTESGEPLRIVYPGRLNDSRGADFRDAVITNGEEVRQGEIELHVNSGDWEAHGHHQDSAYNSVILHVVLENNSSLTMHRANGELLPTLCLHRYLEKRLRAAVPVLPCSEIGIRYPEKVKQVLDEAGETRFRQKASQFQEELQQHEAGEVLYRAILGALGYSKNKIPCIKLADLVPLSILESLARSLPEEESSLHQQALSFGAAGLLPSRRSVYEGSPKDIYLAALENLWAEYYSRESLPPGSWNLFKVRPNNSPLRRIAALGYLIWRFREKGLLNSLVALVENTAAENGRELAEAFQVNASGYWAGHYDFGLTCSGLSPALIGADRAGEIIVNVLLPFIHAQNVHNLQTLEISRCFPVLSANSIEKHVQHQLGIGKGVINSACRQQGLIHIYKTLCTQGKCTECRLNNQ